MDEIGLIIALILLGTIVIYLKDIRDRIIPAKLSSLERTTILTSILAVIVLTFSLGNTAIHYVVGVLGGMVSFLNMQRRGITTKGFRGTRGFRWGNWKLLKSVHVSKNEKAVRIQVTGRFNYYDVQYYEKEYFDQIVSILQDNVAYNSLEID